MDVLDPCVIGHRGGTGRGHLVSFLPHPGLIGCRWGKAATRLGTSP
jgi:hypothetical protein